MPDSPGTQWLRRETSRKEILRRNMPYVNRKHMRPWNTPLSQLDEFAFRDWLKRNNVPFDPETTVSDYDMRGFWQALQAGDTRARSAVDRNDRMVHYPDYWKTPYHETFSAESQWALPTAPRWNAQDQLIASPGRVLFDDRRR
jgi:hypothetical protein